MGLSLVYILGKGSKWDNTELRYSLRSAEKYLTYENVYIIGECPLWLQNITHIPAIDPYPLNKERNIFNKILRACTDPRISEDFIFINDDHFVLKPQKEIPYYNDGDMQGYLKKRKVSSYSISVNSTMQALKRINYPTLFFDVHTPIIYNKEKFQELRQFDWGIRGGYIIKSLYCNLHSLPGTPEKDCKLQKAVCKEMIEEKIKGRDYFSIGDGAINNDLLKVLNELYPDKSKYEI